MKKSSAVAGPSPTLTHQAATVTDCYLAAPSHPPRDLPPDPLEKGAQFARPMSLALLPPPRALAHTYFPCALSSRRSRTDSCIEQSMAMAQWLEAAKEAVAAYTGMTTGAAFFTAVAVAAALYVAVFSGLLARPAPPPRRREEVAGEERAFQPLPPPVQLGEVTEEELRAYDGSDPQKPLLMAIKGQIYDVTQSRMFYGPGGPYALFAGRDASRALAKMSFEPSDLTGDISGLGPFEVQALHEWDYKFKNKYMTVGKIKKTIPVAVGDAGTNVGTSERDIDLNPTESSHASDPTNNGATTNQRGEERPWETPDEDVNTSCHEDVPEKPKELPGLEMMNPNSHDDSMEELAGTANAFVTNKSSTEDPVAPKGTPDIDDTSRPEDAMEQAKQAPDVVDVKNSSSHEELKGTPDVDEKNVGSHQDVKEKPKGTSDAEVKDA
ncbi:hypothetical protein ACP70R_026567 [Stipagrostis hirtigluma subsp. patula]